MHLSSPPLAADPLVAPLGPNTINFLINWSTSELNTHLNPKPAWVTQVVGFRRVFNSEFCFCFVRGLHTCDAVRHGMLTN